MAVAVRHRGNGRVGVATAVAIEMPSIPPVAFDHEELVIRRGERSGIYCIVAAHSTAARPGARRASSVVLSRGDRRRAGRLAARRRE